MTIDEAHIAMVELSDRQQAEILRDFSLEVGVHMMASLAAMAAAVRIQCEERKDSRDVVIALARMFMEADNLSTLVAVKAANTILGKDE